MSDTAGRSCPLHYRYGAERMATVSETAVDTLYVVGGLYGNLPALDAIEAMSRQESGPVRLCFNGDFNWFNVDAASFDAINQRVLAHDAILGNVEAELLQDSDDAGCGCAYPEDVDAATVERSNRIHARLKATAREHPALQARLGALAMLARYRVGDCRVGVVHGDAESLSGWRFDVSQLRDPEQDAWLAKVFEQSQVDVFASTHTCLPALKWLAARVGQSGKRAVINNGAAGMPNLRGSLDGLVTRIGLSPSPHPVAWGTKVSSAYVDAVLVAFDQARWQHDFLTHWPAQSDAHQSYFARIQGGTHFEASDALLGAGYDVDAAD